MFFDKDVEVFLRDFLRELHNQNVAVFAGAGLSSPSEEVDWKRLMNYFCKETGLALKREPDLVNFAGYYLQQQAGARPEAAKRLIELFTLHSRPGKNYRILARLPVPVYWTTNYDNWIEQSLRDNGKRPDVKSTSSDFIKNVPGRDAIVYKMHGDDSHPEEAILTRHQYESYCLTHPFFMNALAGDFSTKTFLFAGFSYDDPNLEYILSRICLLNKHHPRRAHYCFFREPGRDAEESEEDFRYRRIRQQMITEQLFNSNIRVLSIKEHEDTTLILTELEKRFKRKTIFISGSAYEYGRFGDMGKGFIRDLSKALLKNDFKIVSGFGLGVGPYIVEGALDEIYMKRKEKITDRLQIFPFPPGGDSDAVKSSYRDNMISQAGTALFIFGNKLEDICIKESDGMLKEFEIARSNNALLIPVGASGYASEKLWKRVIEKYDDYFETREKYELYEQLGNPSIDPETLIDTIIRIAN